MSVLSEARGEPAADADGEPAPDPPTAPRRARSDAALTTLIVAGSVLLVLSQLSPRDLLTTTTTTGGDAGAHVWAADYLQHHLLPHGRLTGWSPDWYAGFPAFVFYFPLPFLLVVVLNVLLPYTVAFKWVTVLGPLCLPVAAFAFGHLCRLRRPAPALLAAATLPFLFDQSYFILGGNLASTLAGEFAFSLSLVCSVLFLGVLTRSLDDGRHRGLATALLAVAVLCHVYAALLAVVGGVITVLVRRERRALTWAAPVFATGAALTAWWTVPFILRLGYTTDMGWEKDTNYLQMLFPFLVHEPEGSGTPVFIGVLALAALAVVVAIRRRHTTPLVLAATAACIVVAFVVVPQGRLYNSRLLPAWFLCIHLLAGLGLADVADLAGRIGRRRWLTTTCTVAAAGVVFIAVGVPLRLVPGWLPLPELHDRSVRVVRADTVGESYVPDWASENYRGYEGTDAWPEYRRLMDTMGRLPCGRALEEYSESLDRYGATTALMLLPYWTDGCITTMEGILYESSATTPYHFLTESELSRTPSQPMRKLPYRDLDVARGAEHLRDLGVRYYLSFSKRANAQATRSSSLRLVATSGPWKIWEVAGSSVVEPLTDLPTVLTNVAKDGRGWLSAAVSAFQAETDHDAAPFATSGPDDWARAEVTRVPSDDDTVGTDLVLPTPDRRSTVPATVSNVVVADDHISFDVDRIGTPVLVKVSYFPNWKASGADGPWRVTPNFMVVVPTSTHVSLHYGTTPVDLLGWLLTAAGAGALAWMARSARSTRRDQGDQAVNVS